MKAQMRAFMEKHKGGVYSASILAANLGWFRTVEDRKYPKARAARSIASKCGASVVPETGGYTIRFPV